MSNEQNIPKGSYIFREGESARYAYVLQSGTIEILKLGIDGETSLAELEEKNTIFGEMALIDGAPRSAGARAKTDVVVTQVDKPNFLNYVAKNPQAAHNIMVKLSQEVRHANAEIADLQTRAVAGTTDRSEGFEVTQDQSHDDVDDTDAIYYTPPSKLLIYAASIIFALFVVAFSFASVFEIDTTVSSRGKFATKVPNVDVQATSNAIVKKVVVERGQTLKKGQVVAILDEIDAKTNLAQNTETLAGVNARLLRIKLEQDYIKTSVNPPAKVSLSNLLKDILKKRIDQYRSKLTSFASRISKLKKEISAAEEEIKSASESVRITKRQTNLKRQIEGARKTLYDRKNGSLLSYLQAQDATLASERSYYDARNLLALKKAALAAKMTDLSILQADKEEFTASWSTKLGEERSKEEEKRVSKAIKIIQNITNIPISVDTCRSKIAQSALELGVQIINDVSGLKFDKDMPKIIERFQPSLIVCAYSNKIVGNNHAVEAKKLLQESIMIARKAKISTDKIVVDPAIGFFRTSGRGFPFTKIRSNWVSRDLAVLQNLRFIKNKFPALVSVSNKSFIGEILQKDDPSDRFYGTMAAELISIMHGADILRTHNVAAAKDILKIAKRMLKNTKKGL